MANEELHQRGYLASGKLHGTKFGDFEKLDIGSTSVSELKAVGVDVMIPALVDFPFTVHKPIKKPPSAKPDVVFLRRQNGKLTPVAVAEHKAPKKFRTHAQLTKAAEQGLYGAVALGATVAVTSDGLQCKYVDVTDSLNSKQFVYFPESRDFGPGVLANLLAGDAGQTKDPAPLAETVWQTIWHATKEEPKQCLLTFVEIFVLKFLSDNLPVKVLPDAYRFYGLLSDPKKFQDVHGITALEYYATKIRPFIKTLFPDNVVAVDPQVATTFGLDKITSKTSVINGFAFWRSSDTLPAFNRTFLDILNDFQKFGPRISLSRHFRSLGPEPRRCDARGTHGELSETRFGPRRSRISTVFEKIQGLRFAFVCVCGFEPMEYPMRKPNDLSRSLSVLNRNSTPANSRWRRCLAASLVTVL